MNPVRHRTTIQFFNFDDIKVTEVDDFELIGPPFVLPLVYCTPLNHVGL